MSDDDSRKDSPVPDRPRWALVGGGMLGMTLAHRLAGQGKDVTLIEAAKSLGGLASAWKLGDVTWDRHYHVILLSDWRLRSLLGELDLGEEMDWVETRTGVFAEGRLYSVSNLVEYMKFPILNVLDQARLAFTILYGSRITDWRRLEQVPVADWLKKISGRRTFEKFWLPLLKSKLGDNYRETSAAFIWATIQRLYAARRSGLKKEMFGYVRGGYARIIDRFAEVLHDDGVRVETDRRVQRIESVGGRIEIQFEGGDTDTFDRVVVSTPTPVAARVIQGLSGDERQRLEGVRYQGIVCPSLLLKKPLADFYVTNILDDWVPFTGVIEMSTLVDRKYFDGNALVYLPRYVTSDDPFLSSSDEEVKESCLGALERMYPTFTRDDVLCFQVSRVPWVMALPTLNYSERLPPMKTSVPGVYVVTSAHIVNGTLNVNETVQLAERAARAFAEGSGDGLGIMVGRT